MIRRSIHRMAAIIAVLALLVPGAMIVLELPLVSAASSYGKITVQGTGFLIDGQAPANDFFGVVDTTVLQYAILTYIYGEDQYAGKSSVFYGPDTGNYPTITPSGTAADLFDQYFALLSYYHCNLVRVGAGDAWGTSIQYDAWVDHHDAFVSLLRTMESKAELHHVWIVLVLAGSTEYPAFQFGGSGTVFDNSSSAYGNYIAYSKGVMTTLSGLQGLAWYDLFNEPDHDICWANYWSTNGGKPAFYNWTSGVAKTTTGVSDHPRTMGVAGLGLMFGWGQADFDMATGKVPFEIASRHYFASNLDNINFATPEQWAVNDNKPLYWGELANNSVYPLIRYDYAEKAISANGGQAITSMVLTGTPSYPYTGGPLNGTSTAPRPSFTISPSSGSTSTVFGFDASQSSDPQDLASTLQVRWDWNGDGSYDTGWSLVKTATHTFTAAGNYPVVLEVIDPTGFTNTTSHFVSVQSAQSVTITSPAEGANISASSFTAQWAVSGSGPAISYYAVYTDDEFFMNMPASVTSFTFYDVPVGAHSLTVTAVDIAGATVSDRNSFVIGTTNVPTLKLTSPINGAILNSPSFTAQWSVSGSTISYYALYTDDEFFRDLPATATSFTFDGVPDGVHSFTVVAVDPTGGTISNRSSFVTDTTAPTVSITSPTSGARLTSSSVTVRWTGSDGGSGIDYYQVRLDSGTWMKVTVTSYTFTGVANGSHSTTVRAVDKAGNLRSVSVSFTVRR